MIWGGHALLRGVLCNPGTGWKQSSGVGGGVGHPSFEGTGTSQVRRCLDKDENSRRARAGQPGIGVLGPPRRGRDSHFPCPPSLSVPKTVVVCTGEEAEKSFHVCSYLIPFNTKYVGVVTPLRDAKPGGRMRSLCSVALPGVLQTNRWFEPSPSSSRPAL